MGAPIPLPQIQLKQFSPDVQKYLPNRLARIRAIGERARQERLQKEAYQRSLAKEYLDTDIKKQKFQSEYWQRKQEEIISDFQHHAASRMAEQDKPFTNTELISMRRYADSISYDLERMALSENQYKEDSKFIASNKDDVDQGFYDAHEEYNPEKHGYYFDYLNSKGVKPKLRRIGTDEFGDICYSEYMKPSAVNKNVQLYENENGDVIEDVTEWFVDFWETDENNVPIKRKINKQFNHTVSMVDRNNRGRLGAMEEYDSLSEEKRTFYESLAENGALEGKTYGYYDTDFTGIKATGDKKDAYLYYFYDKEGDDIFKVNKYLGKEKDKSLSEDKKTKYKNGVRLTKDNRIDVGSIKTTDQTFKDGSVSDNYVQLGDNSMSVDGVIKGVQDVSGQGEIMDNNIMQATDYEKAKLIGFTLDENNNHMMHLKIDRGTTLKKDNKGNQIYYYRNYGVGTIEELAANIRKVDKDKGYDKKTINETISRMRSIEGDEVYMISESNEKDWLAPVKGNEGIVKGYYLPSINNVYIYDGVEFSEDDVIEAAKNLGISKEEYISKYKIETKK